jgi:hypothetical protein
VICPSYIVEVTSDATRGFWPGCRVDEGPVRLEERDTREKRETRQKRETRGGGREREGMRYICVTGRYYKWDCNQREDGEGKGREKEKERRTKQRIC